MINDKSQGSAATGLKCGLICHYYLITVQELNKSSAVAEMGDRLATIYMGRNRYGSKSGRADLPFAWGAASPSNNVAWDEAYIRTKWHLDPFNLLATIAYTNVTERQELQDNGPVA